MPLPDDEKLVALAQDIISQFDVLFGLHPGFRPAHAKGVLLKGTFTPAPTAIALTWAPHVQKSSTPVTVRFSNATGIPVIPDGDPNASPRGLAIRFHLGERVHTDIISDSMDGFPAKNGQEFLEFLKAAASKDTATPTAMEKFLSTHPHTLAFIQAPKPAPSSFAREAYFGVTAMNFTNKTGASRFGRYRIVPEAGIDHLDAAAAAARGPNFLFDELNERIAKGPIGFRILVQVANNEDTVDDATVHWPEDRPLHEFGSITLTGPVPDDAHEQKNIIFDPIPRVVGIEPSGDPLLELRAAVYLISGRRRRAAAG